MAIGVAIIGSGIFVRTEHLPATLATPNLQLKALYSRSLKSAKTVADGLSGVDLYSDDSGEGRTYDDLLRRDDIQAVIIALPIPNQPAYARAALSANKHVLAEKPIAKDVAAAKELLGWWHSSPIDKSKVTFGIAENFRYVESFLYAAEQVRQLGRVLSFRTRVNGSMSPGNEYFETTWRKTPEYQGGFLLDGGIHFVAATRLLLQPENEFERVSAQTTLLQEYLAPVDTVDATFKTKSDITGTFSVSFGNTFVGSEYAIACEQGTVTVTRGAEEGPVVGTKVTVRHGGKEYVKDFNDESMGVKPEVKAWADGLAAGKPNDAQSPEQALKDLEVLEAMLKSGEKGGTPIELNLG